MSKNRHTNKAGYRRTKNGKRAFEVEAMAKKLGINFVVGDENSIKGKHPDWESKGRKTRAKKHRPTI